MIGSVSKYVVAVMTVLFILYPAVPAGAWPPCPQCCYWNGEECMPEGRGCCDCINCHWVGNDAYCDANQCLICDSYQCSCQSTCDPNQHCCDGTCCENYECCINGQCVDPMCDNCHSVSDTLFECGHYAGAPSGIPCSTDWCIINVLNSAGCDYKGPDWPCKKSKCNTTAVLPYEDEITQYVIRPSNCPGGTVDWTTWRVLYYGCYSCGWTTYQKSCETFGCPGSVDYSLGRGVKKQCGGCVY